MDYSSWLSLPPYSWTQEEKEKIYLPYFQRLTEHHRTHCALYRQALRVLGYPTAPCLFKIPMLPISLFKTFSLKSIVETEIFKTLVSSGTTGQAVSKIYLDAATAQNQQLTLYAIIKDFLGPNRLPMLIIDSPSVLRNREQFNARGAAILGFSMFAKKKFYALTENLEPNVDVIQQFCLTYANERVLIFGFTFMIWKYFCQALSEKHLAFSFPNAFVLHGGGWKKMQDQAVSPIVYKNRLQEQFHISHVHNYYGMAEQTGCIYMECECGHLHASIFSDIIVRNPTDFSICPVGETGIVQVLSPNTASYPGHSILTEDLGTLLGIDDCPCGRKGKYFRIDGRIPKAEIRGCSDTHG